MPSPSNALNISEFGLVFFDGVKTFTGKTLISSDNTIVITVGASTINLQASDTQDVQTLTGNSGVATPIGGTINVTTNNSTVTFVGSSGNLVQDFDLPTNLVLGSSLPSALVGATRNVAMGSLVLDALTSGDDNSAFGWRSQNSNATGLSNCSFGSTSLFSIEDSNFNNGFGSGTLNLFVGSTSNGGNDCLGGNALFNLLEGEFNIGIGFSAGISYTSNESNNILINNIGIVGESNTIRIGTQGTGTRQQDRCFLAGILNTVSGRVIKLTTPGAYPYTALTTDYMILVDTSAARTINLMASPTTGTQLVIKDNVGSAAANNITITPNAGNIDGAASASINTNYGSMTIVYNGTQWNII